MKKVLSLMLALTLAVGMFPMSVSAKTTFKDVSVNDWFYENVNTAVELGLMVGISDNEFAPNGKVTLAMAVTLASRVHSIYMKDGEQFKTTQGDWYRPYVDYAKEKKIIAEEMNWDNDATRLEIAQIFSKSLPQDALKVINDIEDNAIPYITSSYSYSPVSTPIYMLYRAGIIIGSDEKGIFYPNATISRAEISAITSRLIRDDLRQKITLKAENTAKKFMLEIQGKHIEYGESLESVKKKLPNYEEETEDTITYYYIGNENNFIAFRDNESKTKEVMGWLTTKSGMGSADVKVGDSYTKVMEKYPNAQYYNGNNSSVVDYDPLNCVYAVFCDKAGYCVSPVEVYALWEEFKKVGGDSSAEQWPGFLNREFVAIGFMVENGIITEIACADWEWELLSK